MPFVIDFLPVGTKSSSGDAIALQYGDQFSGYTTHIVDGGYSDTASGLIDQITIGYGSTDVSHVVLTHADGDHAAGLVKVLESLNVGTLWMNRPWLYASEIVHHFHGNWTVIGLEKHLRDQYPTLVDLEAIATRRGIPIRSAFQGSQIGKFIVLAPSRERYVALLPEFDQTPERRATADSATGLMAVFLEASRKAVRRLFESWFSETLSEHPEPTSASNESSVVQMAVIDEHQIVLTGDAGPQGLNEAADYAEALYARLAPRFIQVPHHGSRRNVTPSVLDRWLGPVRAENTWPIGTAFCSAARLDDEHPRQKVVNAFTRRGYQVYATNGAHIYHQYGINRQGSFLSPLAFSDSVEE